MIGAWTDGNLHNYTINGQSVGIYVSNSEQPLACANIVELPVTSGIVDVDTTLFTMSQRSPFDPTIINVGVDIPMADYQINNDGNVRDNMQGMQSTTCYSNMVYQPFEPFQPVDNNVTLDSYAVGNLSSKHMIEGGLALSDKILPLTNLYSALGHNVMVTPNDGSRATCGTLGFTEGSNVRIIRASAGFDSDAMTGYVRLVSDISYCNLNHFEMHIFVDADIHYVRWSVHCWTDTPLLAAETQCPWNGSGTSKISKFLQMLLLITFRLCVTTGTFMFTVLRTPVPRQCVTDLLVDISILLVWRLAVTSRWRSVMKLWAHVIS